MKTKSLPDFFEGRTNPWRFDAVLSFIDKNFKVKKGFAFRVGSKENSAKENQSAGIVLAYAILMNYSFNQVKALFSEHDHFAIAMPETRKGKNIEELNKIYHELLQKGHPWDVRLNSVAEYFSFKKDILQLKGE